jgi:hypothetical protein
VAPGDGGEVWQFVRFCYDVRGVSPRTIEGYVSSAVIARPGKARPCAGGAAAVLGGGGLPLHSSEPAPSSPCTPSLLSRPESRVWALHVTCGPRTTRRRVRPALGPGCAGSPLLCVGVDPRALGWHGVCVHRAPAAPSCLAGAVGACDRVCVWYVWVGRLGTQYYPPPSFPDPVLHATACAPRNLQAPARVCDCVCLGWAGVCAWHALVTHTLIPGAWLATLCGGLGVGRRLGG